MSGQLNNNQLNNNQLVLPNHNEYLFSRSLPRSPKIQQITKASARWLKGHPNRPASAPRRFAMAVDISALSRMQIDSREMFLSPRSDATTKLKA